MAIEIQCFDQYSPYNIQANLISPTDSVSNLQLGVLIDDKLEFHAHTASVTAKANRILAIIHKFFHFTDNNLLINLYISLVRPIIEYGNIYYST